MKLFDPEITRIKLCLQTKELPGIKAQLKMAPVTRLTEIAKSQSSVEHGGTKNKFPKKSAVLILLYPKNNTIYLVMMVRAADNTVHSGQVSFPGGKVEKSDTSISHTALREAHEEIGVLPNTVDIIGELTKLYIPPSNFDVYPVIGVTNSTPVFSPNNEVHKLLEVKLSTLFNPNQAGYEKIYHRTGGEFVVPCYHINGEIVWGATAMMLAELLDVISN
jgi:8-oxo-dGTP pyrophosphatase MutT (NUDIX family)